MVGQKVKNDKELYINKVGITDILRERLQLKSVRSNILSETLEKHEKLLTSTKICSVKTEKEIYESIKIILEEEDISRCLYSIGKAKESAVSIMREDRENTTMWVVFNFERGREEGRKEYILITSALEEFANRITVSKEEEMRVKKRLLAIFNPNIHLSPIKLPIKACVKVSAKTREEA